MSIRPMTISRQLNAPIAKVWKAWTDEESLKNWFGPPGCPIVQSQMDFCEGGMYHYAMKIPTGQTMWGRWDFVKIEPEKRFVMLNAFSTEDPKQNIRHPLSPSWPLLTHSTTEFEEKDGGTLLTITWSPHEASMVEIATFDASHEAMRLGWDGTFKQLEAYLYK